MSLLAVVTNGSSVWGLADGLGISQNSILTPREYLALEPNTSIIMRPSV